MRAEDFDYHLPSNRIAQTPVEPRDASRLMLLPLAGGPPRHATFRDLPACLRSGDCLVVNDSRVLPARLLGRRPGGGEAEVLLLRRHEAPAAAPPPGPSGPAPDDRSQVWEALIRPAKRLPPGARVSFGQGELTATVAERLGEGRALVRLEAAAGAGAEDVGALLARLGRAPLPPYIKAPLADAERYQTVYAREEGSAAAPTAGLHFTPRLLEELTASGVETVGVTLHVGLGTFRPLPDGPLEDVRLHSEAYRVPPEAARAVLRARERGGRIIAVGTTATRSLEAWALAGAPEAGIAAFTDLFIRPGYRFGAIDGLITNFHLPRSSLLLLVAALVGRDRLLSAYEEAAALGYRFYSFGDAMLIL